MNYKEIYKLVSHQVVSKVILLAARWELDKLLKENSLKVSFFSKNYNYSSAAVIKVLRILEALQFICFIDEEVIYEGENLHLLASIRSPHLFNSTKLIDNLELSMVTNSACYQDIFGKSFQNHISQSEKERDTLSNWRNSSGELWLYPSIFSLYNFTNFKNPVELGSDGDFLLACIKNNFFVCGSIFIEPALEQITQEKQIDLTKVKIIKGNIKNDTLPAGDLYFFCRALLNYDDNQLVEILSNCKKSVSSDARLLIIDFIMPNKKHPDYFLSTLADINILTCLGGCLRTESLWMQLAELAGFKVNNFITSNKKTETILPIFIMELISPSGR